MRDSDRFVAGEPTRRPERRRTKDLSCSGTAILVQWTTKNGEQILLPAEAESINRDSAVLQLKGRRLPPAKFQLLNPRTRCFAFADAIWVGKRVTDGFIRVGVTLSAPSKSLWKEEGSGGQTD